MRLLCTDISCIVHFRRIQSQPLQSSALQSQVSLVPEIGSLAVLTEWAGRLHGELARLAAGAGIEDRPHLHHDAHAQQHAPHMPLPQVTYGRCGMHSTPMCGGLVGSAKTLMGTAAVDKSS